MPGGLLEPLHGLFHRLGALNLALMNRQARQETVADRGFPDGRSHGRPGAPLARPGVGQSHQNHVPQFPLDSGGPTPSQQQEGHFIPRDFSQHLSFEI